MQLLLKLTWRRTWADVPGDFCAYAPEALGPVGRVYEIYSNTGSTIWLWACFGWLPDRSTMLNGLGREETKHAALMALEAYWFEAVASLSGTRP